MLRGRSISGADGNLATPGACLKLHPDSHSCGCRLSCVWAASVTAFDSPGWRSRPREQIPSTHLRRPSGPTLAAAVEWALSHGSEQRKHRRLQIRGAFSFFPLVSLFFCAPALLISAVFGEECVKNSCCLFCYNDAVALNDHILLCRHILLLIHHSTMKSHRSLFLICKHLAYQ